MTHLYQKDLAAAHAAGFAGLSLAGGTVVLDALRAARLDHGTIVDLGCGSGEWVHRAVAHGFDAVGVDVSVEMIALARARTDSARFATSTLWDFQIPGPVVAVTAFGEALTYGAPALPNSTDLRALCRHVSAALVQGGVFVFDVILAGEPMRYRNWTDAAGHTILVDVEEDPAASTLTRSITVFAREGTTFRRSDERHVVRVYKQRDIEQALASTGFSWTTMQAYGDVALGPRRLAFMARRAG